ncbi:MAG: (d)CMP kinase [Cytophagales bacterium]|nr:(d)CMP kinase [Cytophagales bacterium]
MKKIVIAVDGYSACGKSSTAKEVASRLGYVYIDTGAMYRAVTLFFLQNFINLTNPKDVKSALDQVNVSFIPNPNTGINEVYLNGFNVEEAIRGMEVSGKVSEVSAIPEVRKAMVYLQRKLGKNKAVVMDGRDIGTFVFPEAELKVFMTADFDVRAARRQQELLERGEMIGFEEVKKNLQHRDTIDTTRKESPLKKADNAHVIDTTQLTMEEQIEQIVQLAKSIIDQ